MIAPGGYLVSPVLVGMDEASYRDKMTFLRENTKLAKPKPSNSNVEGSGAAVTGVVIVSCDELFVIVAVPSRFMAAVRA